jgi:hypothetical protein
MAKTKEKAQEIKENLPVSQTVTAEEAAIMARITAEDSGWKEIISEEAMNDFSLSDDPYALPEPAKKKEDQRKYKFRWIEKKPRRIDFIRNLDIPKRWWLCNSTNTPFLKGFFDPIHGGVQKLDQILVFKPWSHHIAQKKLNDQLKAAQRNSGEIPENHMESKIEEGAWLAGNDVKIKNSDIVHNEDLTDDLGDLIT